MAGPLGTIARIAKALFATPEIPDDAVSAAILAHLAEHGRTRSQDLWRIFRKGPTGTPGAEAAPKGHVSLAKLMFVLERLEDQGEVYAMRETHGGRRQAFWNLNTFGGKRGRDRVGAPDAPATAPGLATA